MDEPGYDVIGDVHGEGTKLEQLLKKMGYTNERGYFAHPTRKAIFVGDLVDRGPEQLLAVRTAKAMADAGTATVVMGNHEFNAIAFHTPHPYRPGQYSPAQREELQPTRRVPRCGRFRVIGSRRGHRLVPDATHVGRARRPSRGTCLLA